jgi:hypothetical protein
MSGNSSIPLLEKFGQRLSPVLLFIGIVGGFSLMVLAGSWAGKQNLFVAYERNYPLISPEGYFYPSLNNLTELVSHVASKRKILVLVGGNSVFLGVGQKKEQLWTKELQRDLGSDFAVVNLAFRGAELTEMGAIVAEVLSNRYPRLVYVTSETSPMRMELSGAGRPYEYLYWQAQASGKLGKTTLSSKEGHLIGANHAREPLTEAELRGYLDYWSHASDLWNYIGYNYVFTVFNFIKYPPEHFFEARRNSEDLVGELPPIPQRFTFQEQSMQIVRSLFQFSVEKSAGGELGIKTTVFDAFMRDARGAFPDAFKPRTLILLAYNAPYFSDQLSQDEHAAYEFAFSQGKSCLQKAGYHAVLIGPDLTNEDFADRVHLAASGGQKMARDTAPEIRAMAVQLGYLPAAPTEQNPEENR